MEKKKTVGIITFHAPYNFGAMLQAYALQHIVDSMGYKSEIINFRTEIQRRSYSNPIPKKNLREIISFFIHFDKYISHFKRANLFEKFLKEDLNVTKQEYRTIEDLNNSNLDYDIYISGSDQIWNTNLIDFSEAYFLDFVKKGKKIAYAPSMGSSASLYAEGKYPEYLKYISDYSHISVRESESENILRKLTGKDVFTAFDPTLLVNIEVWDKIAGDKPLLEYKYIFGYSPWKRQEDLITFINKIAEYNSKIAIFPFNYLYNSDKRIWKNIQWESLCGPREFLNYIKFADFIVCESFHAVIFSLIFQKPFVCLNMTNDIRINQILGVCGLKHLMLDDDSVDTLNISDFKSNNIDSLKPLINQSLTWLKEALES